MTSLRIKTVTVTPFQQNARVIIDESTKKGIVLDPGGEVERILQAAEDIELSGIFLTHAHIDHAGGVAELQRIFRTRTGGHLRLFGHPSDQPLRGSITAQAALFGVGDAENCPEPEVLLEEGETVPVGSLRAKVLFTPGHAPGHVSFLFPELPYRIEYGQSAPRTGIAPVVLSGDVLFLDTVGRTDLPLGDGQTLMRSIREKIFTLPDNTVVVTGHGPDTTVGREKRENPFFR